MTNEWLNNLFGKQLRAFRSVLIAMLLALPSVASEPNVPHTSHAGNLILSVKGDRVSARIENESLQKVLEELGKRANIKVVVSKFTEDRIISLSFEHLLLTDALKQILWNRSYFFSAGSNGFIRVLGNTGSRSSQTLSQSTSVLRDSSVFKEDLSQEKLVIDRANDLYTSDPESHLAALKELVQKGKANQIKDAQPLLITTLEDEAEDAQTRMLALEALDRLKEGAPIEALVSVASSTNPDMRVQALGLIVERGMGEAAQYLSQAMDDPDPKVRSFALQVSEYFPDL